MSIYDKFIQECENRTLTKDNEKAKLLYELVSNNPRAQLSYSSRNGHSFDQCWLYSKVVTGTVLIQATRNKNGSIQLSIQGVRNVKPGVKNFLDFYGEEHELFMQYLVWF